MQVGLKQLLIKALKSTFLPRSREYREYIEQIFCGFAIGILLFAPIEYRRKIPMFLWALLLVGTAAVSVWHYHKNHETFSSDKTCAYFIGLFLAGGILCVSESIVGVDCNGLAVMLTACAGVLLVLARNIWLEFSLK